jgi:hypothetical protein
MKHRVLVFAVLVAGTLLAAPTTALAKGASAATISADGSGGGRLDRPITLRGNGEPGSGTDLGNLADLAGLFPAMFEGDSSMLAEAPTKRLGPRYTITWTIPDGDGTDRRVVQSVWPYAAGGPVTYVKAGQPVLGDRTRGGWFRATDSLRQNLVALGLPKQAALTEPAATPAPAPRPAPARPAPATTAGDPPSAWPRVLVAGAFLLLVAGTTLLVLRRRPGAATTAR